MDGLFALEEGTVITVPNDVVLQDSKNWQQNAKTPSILRLKEFGKKKKQPLFEVRTHEDDGRLREAFEYRGKVLFVPEKVSFGDKLKIVWVDPTCACAALAN